MPTTDELAAWLLDRGYAEASSGYGHVSADDLAEALMTEFDINGSADLSINPNQHCTYEPIPNSSDFDYSFSHTAQYCDRPQPRRCGCAFCY